MWETDQRIMTLDDAHPFIRICVTLLTDMPTLKVQQWMQLFQAMGVILLDEPLVQKSMPSKTKRFLYQKLSKLADDISITMRHDNDIDDVDAMHFMLQHFLILANWSKMTNSPEEKETIRYRLQRLATSVKTPKEGHHLLHVLSGFHNIFHKVNNRSFKLNVPCLEQFKWAILSGSANPNCTNGSIDTPLDCIRKSCQAEQQGLLRSNPVRDCIIELLANIESFGCVGLYTPETIMDLVT